jgi:hypothetical protein
MGRKSASKIATTRKNGRDSAGLFPDVAPVRPKKGTARKKPSAPVAVAPAKPVSRKTPSGPVVATSAPVVATSAPSRKPLLAAGGVALAGLALAGIFGPRLLAAENDRAPSARAAVVVPAATARRIDAPSAPSPESSVVRPTASAAPSAHAAVELAAPSVAASDVKTVLGASLKELVAASAARDQGGLDALKERLHRLAAENPTAALAAVLDAMKGETDPQSLTVLSSVLLDEALAGRPDVLAAIADVAQKDELPARRAAAVRTLGDLPGGDAARVELIGGLERQDTDPLVRATAAAALGAVGERSPGPVAAAAAKCLVDAFASEQDPHVRASLLYAMNDTRDPAVADALLGTLAHDQDLGARLAAADVLGTVAAAYRARAVDALAAQFGQESDGRVLETIIRSVVAAGRLSAIPVLQKMRGGAGDLQATIDDWLAGLQSGEDDMNKLEAIKAARETARAR